MNQSDIAYIRFREGEPRELRPFGPKSPDHYSAGDRCPMCLEPMEEGCFTALIPLGPGPNPEAQDKARDGRWYNAMGLEVHWACATGKPDPY